MKRIPSGLQFRRVHRTGARVLPLLLVSLAAALLGGTQVPAQNQPAAPAPAAPSPKPLPKWSAADWKAYGTSIANDPAVQKLPPLERAKYVADKVGQQYDAAGIAPNYSYFGKGRQGLGNDAPGTCGDLTVNVEAALEGAGFQTGSIELEKTGAGYYNPFNVNRTHGAPIVTVDGKEYVFDLWYHSGSEGKFSGFKDSAFAMPIDDWKSQMKEEGYKIITYAPPPPPPATKKAEPEAPAPEPETPPEPVGKTGSDETTGQTPEPATTAPDDGSPPADGQGEPEAGDTAGNGANEGESAEGDTDEDESDAAEPDEDESGEGESDADEPDEGETDAGEGGDDESNPDNSGEGESEEGESDEGENGDDKPGSDKSGDDSADDGDSDAEESGEGESGENESGDDEPGAGADDGQPEGESSDSGKDPDSGGAPGDTTTGYVENSEGRITVTETRGPDGSLTRVTETETDKAGNVKGTTTYEGGTGEGKYTKYTPAGDGLKGAEPPPDGEVSPETVSGGVNTSGAFAQNWSQSQNQRGADGSMTMAQNTQMGEAANAGNQIIRDASTVRDGGGRDSQSIRDAAARATAKSDRDNSWGKAIGNAVESGITEGGKAFGAALGGAAADVAVDEIFGSDKDASDGGDGGKNVVSSAAPPPPPASGAAPAKDKKPPTKTDGGSGASAQSDPSGGGDGETSSPASSSPDDSQTTSSTPGASGGASSGFIGHCPRCGRTDLVEHVVETPTMDIHDWRCPACNVTGRSGPPPSELGSDTAPPSTESSTAPPPPKKTRSGCPFCKATVAFRNDNFELGPIYQCANGHVVKERDLITVEE